MDLETDRFFRLSCFVELLILASRAVPFAVESVKQIGCLRHSLPQLAFEDLGAFGGYGEPRSEIVDAFVDLGRVVAETDSCESGFFGFASQRGSPGVDRCLQLVSAHARMD